MENHEVVFFNFYVSPDKHIGVFFQTTLCGVSPTLTSIGAIQRALQVCQNNPGQAHLYETSTGSQGFFYMGYE